MSWYFAIGKHAQSSMSGNLFEPLSQNAVRDKDLFYLEDAGKKQRKTIIFLAASAEGTRDNRSHWSSIDAEKVDAQIVFMICEIDSSTGNHPRGDLGFSHTSTSLDVQ